MTYIERILATVPFGLAVLIILAIAVAATKLFPAFGEWMNRPDEPKETVAEYRTSYDVFTSLQDR